MAPSLQKQIAFYSLKKKDKKNISIVFFRKSFCFFVFLKFTIILKDLVNILIILKF